MVQENYYNKNSSTLLPPDGGVIKVNGHDVVKDADKVRASIGLTLPVCGS